MLDCNVIAGLIAETDISDHSRKCARSTEGAEIDRTRQTIGETQVSCGATPLPLREGPVSSKKLSHLQYS